MRRTWLLLPVLILTSAAACAAPRTGHAERRADDRSGTEPYVVLVSFDGMRSDMIERAETPYFDRIAGGGVRAEGLIPAYPSKTLPNHYTMATGLYPVRHGLVDNAFYDPAFDAEYRLSDTAAVGDGRWYRGEPIWVTAERQGVRAASYFWVGAEAEIDGVRPTYFKDYDGSVPYEARVDTVLQWLSLPRPERPRLILLYFDEPDNSAHEVGPDAPAVDSIVERLDGILGRLVEGLDDLPIGDRVNLVLVSDHGMTHVPEDHVVYLEDAVSLADARVINNSTQALLYLDGDTARAHEIQLAVNGRLDHVTAYRPAETPEHWHYEGNRRVGDLIVAADPGWVIGRRDGRTRSSGGTHGWDPASREMHGIFLARGPRLYADRAIPAFESIHVHPLVAHLLEIEPADDIDGRLEMLQSVIRARAP